MFKIKGLEKRYPVKGGGGKQLHALDGVDLEIFEGETLALVGESGCGKSTLARIILRLEEPSGGKVEFKGRDLRSLDRGEVLSFRKAVQMVFQDPYASLNPKMRIGDILSEPIKIHKMASPVGAVADVRALLEKVGLPLEAENRYPMEFSGGQRQRVGIGRALAVDPELIVADEPVSALDVSVQAQILNLLMEIKEQKGLTYLFISHDLMVVEKIADRVAVMYLGKMVETGAAEQLFEKPLHPYTRALLEAVADPDPDAGRIRASLEGDPPGPVDRPEGCSFHPRCPRAMDECSREEPLTKKFDDGRTVSCHLYK